MQLSNQQQNKSTTILKTLNYSSRDCEVMLGCYNVCCMLQSLTDAHYLLVYVWLTMQELVGGFLMSAASHGALLEEQRVQLTD